MLKSLIDMKAKRVAKGLLLKTAGDNGFDLNPLMTCNVESKLDDLLQAIIDDVGYLELVKLGFKKDL